MVSVLIVNHFESDFFILLDRAFVASAWHDATVSHRKILDGEILNCGPVFSTQGTCACPFLSGVHENGLELARQEVARDRRSYCHFDRS